MTRPLGERLTLALPGLLPDAPSAARVRGGRAALDASVRWEQYLEREHQRAAVAGLATLWQVGRPTIGYDDKGAPVYGTTGPDFVGLLLDGSARTVAVEAKSRGERRLSRDDLGARQREDLAAVDAAAGLALVAVELRGVGRYVLPWRELEARWNRARGTVGSVGAEELEGFNLLDHPAGYLAAFITRGSP